MSAVFVERRDYYALPAAEKPRITSNGLPECDRGGKDRNRGLPASREAEQDQPGKTALSTLAGETRPEGWTFPTCTRFQAVEGRSPIEAIGPGETLWSLANQAGTDRSKKQVPVQGDGASFDLMAASGQSRKP
jgi:hypothetical protein